MTIYMHLQMTDSKSMVTESSEIHQLITGSNPELTSRARAPKNLPAFWHKEKSLLSMIQPTSPRKSAKVIYVGIYSNV